MQSFKISKEMIAIVLATIMGLSIVGGTYYGTNPPSPAATSITSDSSLSVSFISHSTTTTTTITVTQSQPSFNSYSTTVSLTETTTFTVTTSFTTVARDSTVKSTVTKTLIQKISTTLNFYCDQSSVEVNEPAHCHAILTTGDGSLPNGSILFSSDGSGTFDTQNCRPNMNSIQCDVDFTPTSDSVNPQTLSAKYSGDQFRSPSSGTFQLSIE